MNALWASDSSSYLMNPPYEVVVPSTIGDPVSSDRLVGQIYYDSSAGAFKGVNRTGGIDTLSVSGNNGVISGGTERVERARIINNGTSCSISRQSGTWLSSASRSSQGRCDITIVAGTFSAAPDCVVTSEAQSSNLVTDPTTSTIQVATFTSASGAFSDLNFHVICMGSR
jgi:hypothetical protein